MVKRNRFTRVVEKLYLVVIFLFLYLPILTLIVLSFNKSKTRGKWAGFSLKWYESLLQDRTILNALFTTLILALLSALIATLFGTLVAFAINQMKRWKKTVFMAITNIPMLNADIVTGISLMLLFIAIDYTMGFSSVLIAHITFNLPFVILSVAPRLRQLNTSAYEAALDLGASKPYAFWRVIFPDILPSVLTGFLLSFTMSLDDFVITHFTKGVGVDTLSTLIYTEQKKGIRPEIYALSTILFVTVFVLLIFYNRHQEAKQKKEVVVRTGRVHYYVAAAGIAVFAVFLVIGYNRTKPVSTDKLNIYNWGEYLEPELIEKFEEETGIEVTYDEFETNESMYPIIAKGAANYDLVCPSDYMIQKMADEGLLENINWKNIPNADNIDEEYWEFARAYDEGNSYSMPYLWGTVGILYNKKMVKETIDSWGVLWDTKYQDNILMQKSVRDAFGVALKYLGYSLNSTDENELEQAKQKLLEQKDSGVVQAYVVDEVRDKMIAGEAAIGVIYSGEALTCQESNPDLEFVIPKEGSNLWMDSWVIPKGAENKENAEKFLNFLSRPEVMKRNFDYITYSIPSSAGRALIEEKEYRESEIAFPDLKSLRNCEVFTYLGEEADERYNRKWKEIMSH
ncbi:MAG: extracellular solute-binding protein [Eubacterium sp.]|nr:extracellular solute-binding protein [Eubacterium sp.]